MAQGCISVIEMTVMLGFVQQNPRCGVMAKGKKIAPVRCVEGGAGVVAVGALCHATFLFVRACFS